MKPLLLAASLLALAAPALARSPEPIPAPPAATQTVDPATLALARETLASLRVDDLLRALAVSQSGKLFGDASAATSSQKTDQAKASAKVALDETVPTLDGELADALAQTLTAEELGQLNTFIKSHAVQSVLGVAFAQASGTAKPSISDQDKADIKAFLVSPTGQALKTKLPALKPRVERIVKAMAPWMLDAFETDYCAHVTCTEQERAQFKDLRAHVLGG